MGFKYWTGAHTKHRLMYHIVIKPKYRKRVLRGKISKDIQRLFYEGSEVNGWWIEEMKVLMDHMHFMIQIKPHECISKVVGHLKGGSSRYLRKEYPEIEEFLWGDSFWSDGYFAETVGNKNMFEIKKYIKNNKESMTRAV